MAAAEASKQQEQIACGEQMALQQQAAAVDMAASREQSDHGLLLARAASPRVWSVWPTALRSARRSSLLPPLAFAGTQQAYYLLGQGGGRLGGAFAVV